MPLVSWAGDAPSGAPMRPGVTGDAMRLHLLGSGPASFGPDSSLDASCTSRIRASELELWYSDDGSRNVWEQN